jgi:multidrug efflux pump subunit AcrA (membrane-fusion protein)
LEFNGNQANVGKESAALNQRQIIFKWLLLSLVLLTACSGLSSEETPPLEPEFSAEEFAPIVSATGIVLPVEWARLSMSSSGVVDEILVNEDDSVTVGQVLVRLQGTEQLQAALAAAQLELVSAQSALNDLHENTSWMAAKSLQDLENTQNALDDLLNSDMQEATALQAIADAEKAVEDAERRLRIRESTADQADIDAARAQAILAKDALDKANEDFEPYANKREDNLVRANLLARQASAQQAYDAAVRNLNALQSSGDELDIAVAQADLATARAQLTDALREWEQVKDGPNRGDIDLLEAQISTAQREYDIYRAGPDPDDLAVAEARLANAQAQLDAAQAALSDLELRAPFDGTVSEIFVHPSEWVTIGLPVLLLADINHLQAETTDLSEIDLALLKIGDEAIVTFDALPDIVVRGVVSRIAPKAAEGAGVNYPVTIELSEIPEQLRWGMTAFVDIEVKD